MKRFTTFMGLMGVVLSLSGCFDDESTSPAGPQQGSLVPASESSTVTSSSSSDDKKSSASKSKSDTKDKDKKETSEHDTTVVKVPTYISSTSIHETPNYSDGIFCWNEGCEKDFEGKSSSSAKKETIAVESNDDPQQSDVPATVSGNAMTDNRDGQTYKIQSIAGKNWMTENLRYKTSSGLYCEAEIDGEKVDVCKKYGSFYVYSAALKACPGGWRLPTREEAEALDKKVEHKWWAIGGRFKIEGDNIVYGLEDEQGYIWVRADGEFNSWRVENYSDKKTHEPQGGSATERAYNIRCVEGNVE